MIEVGDYVVRISYNRDVLFQVIDITPKGIAKLKGMSYRIIADAPLNDLELVGGMRLTLKENDVMEQIQATVEAIQDEKKRQQLYEAPILQKIGKVLHVDGDNFYLSLCMKYYETLEIPAIGESIMEQQQPHKIAELIRKHNPDILVLTGHDALNKNYKDLYDINEYKHSKYFIEAVKEARRTQTGNKHLIIFAGACQSYFEALLEAGADYAAAPKRVLIHALDPVFIVERIAYCPFNAVLPIEQAIKNTITRFKGLGGYEILGVARKGGPVVHVQEDPIRDKKNKKFKKGDFSGKHTRIDKGRAIKHQAEDEDVLEENIARFIGDSMPRLTTPKKPF